MNITAHLLKTGGQVFIEGLDGADFVILYQLRQAAVCLTVSCEEELPLIILGDDEMATPVVAPLEEMHIQ